MTTNELRIHVAVFRKRDDGIIYGFHTIAEETVDDTHEQAHVPTRLFTDESSAIGWLKTNCEARRLDNVSPQHLNVTSALLR